MSCQLTATTAAVQLAKRIGAGAVATGFAGYQRSWIEQSTDAEVILRRALALEGLHLELPAATLESKDAATSALASLSLTTHSLEQKCVIQQFNPELSEPERASALNEWESRLLLAAAEPQQLKFRGPYCLADWEAIDD
jgi:hypothetical protein